MVRRPDITGAQHVGTDPESGTPVYRAIYKAYQDWYDECASCGDAGIQTPATTTRRQYALCEECADNHDRGDRELRFQRR